MRLGWIVLGITMLASTEQGLAGPRVGNGGGAWICRDKATGLTAWSTLVDLFEAEHEFSLPLEASAPRDPWLLLDEKVSRIHREIPTLAAMLPLSPEGLREITRFLPDSSELTQIDDGMIRVRPAATSCNGGYLFYGQAANFTHDGRLLIARDIWDDPVFTDNDRAALLLHEIIYKALRERHGDLDSSRARRVVGLLFSTLPAERVAEHVNELLFGPPPGRVPLPRPRPKPPVLVCDASLAVFAPTEGVSGATLKGTKEKLETSLGSFYFSVILRAGSPVGLEIRDHASGARVTLPEDIVRAVFSRNGEVSATLESTKDKSLALLVCRAGV